MAQLFVPLTGPFGKAAGSGLNTCGENLDRTAWRGAELGFLDTFADVWGAVSEAEFHEWIIGVHHPLYQQGGPAWCRFFDRDPAVREQALEQAASSAQSARRIGARYILFHFPWPGFAAEGVDYACLGWHGTDRREDLSEWTESALFEVSLRAFEHLAQVQDRQEIGVVLELDGPNPYFFAGEMYSRLFARYPDLSLCIDTGRLGLLARTHGQDPLELCRRWLPWARHLHLHTSMWDEQGRFKNHLPTSGSHRADRWPQVTPAADMAEMVLAAQPRCTVVLEHDPRSVTPAELETAHAWAGALVGL